MIDNTKIEQDYQCIQYLTNVTNMTFAYQVSLVWESALGSLPIVTIFISPCAMGHNKLFCLLHKAALARHIYICSFQYLNNKTRNCKYSLWVYFLKSERKVKRINFLGIALKIYKVYLIIDGCDLLITCTLKN